MRFVFKTTYDQDINLFKDRTQLYWYLSLFLVLLVLPFVLDDFLVGEITGVFIWAIAGMGLMLLVGQSGQGSLGHAAFMALGAYSNGLLQMHLGLPFILSLPLAACITGFVGYLIALPITRLHGVYLAIATLALSVITEDIIVITESVSGGVTGLFVPDIEILGWSFNRYANPVGLYFLIFGLCLLTIWIYRNIQRSPLGRAFTSVRDSEISASAMGVNVPQTKALAFGISCAITAVGGALMGHFAGIFNHETFNIVMSINLLMMIVIGGLGTIHGAFFGALVIGLLPLLIAVVRDTIISISGSNNLVIPGLESGIFGLILILFLLFEPLGIYGRWVKVRTWFELFPFYRRGMFRRQASYLKTERQR